MFSGNYTGNFEEEDKTTTKKLIPKEKQTLIPLMVKMFNDAIITQNDVLEYQSVPLHEVCNYFLN